MAFTATVENLLEKNVQETPNRPRSALGTERDLQVILGRVEVEEENSISNQLRRIIDETGVQDKATASCTLIDPS